MTRTKSAPWRAFLALSATACATLGAEGEGNRDLPAAGGGPFRKLTSDEVPGLAPYVFDSQPDRYREPAALDDGEDVLLYVTAFDRASKTDVIVRTRAKDGRSFYGANVDIGHVPPVVLRPDSDWEGTSVSGASVLREGGEIWMYYAAVGGIGRARSSDGIAFTKDGLVLPADPSSEPSPPRAPSAFRGGDGAVHLFYSSGCAIWEAISDDGRAFRRTDGRAETPARDPVLVPSPPKASLAPGEPQRFDTACVGDPHVTTHTTPAGRFHTRVLYTGVTGTTSSIGFAARYGDSGPLSPNELPTFAVGLGERAPTSWESKGRLFLYVEMDKSLDENTFPAIGGGISPAIIGTLSAPSKFPDVP